MSPEPDVKCIPIDPSDKCLLLASDGLWNMMMTKTAIRIIQDVEEENYNPEIMESVLSQGSKQLSPSRALVHTCMNLWYQSRFRADNTTVLTVLIDHLNDNYVSPNPLLPSSYSLVPDRGGCLYEDEDSDDGYDEGCDNIDFFGEFIERFTNNSSNNNERQVGNNNATQPSSSSSSLSPSSSSVPGLHIFVYLCL